MTSREHKYLKGDKWMTFFGGEPFKVPAKHWFMRRRIARMTTAQYIRWKQQQCIQQDLNEKIVGFDSWILPAHLSRMLAPEVKQPYMAFMLPSAEPLTHADGSPVQLKPEFCGQYTWQTPGDMRTRGLFMRDENLTKFILQFPINSDANQGETDERSVATNASSE